MTQTLYEQAGGAAAISSTVARLYDRIAEDRLLFELFEQTSIATLRNCQRTLVAAALKSPGPNHVASVREAYRPLCEGGHMKAAHYERITHHVAHALKEIGLSDALIEEARANLHELRDTLLQRR